jgi:hypothetical protein
MGEAKEKAERLALVKKLSISDRERFVLTATMLQGPPVKSQNDLRSFNRTFERLALDEFETAKEVKMADFPTELHERDMTVEGLEFLFDYLKRAVEAGAINGFGSRILGPLMERIEEAKKA